MNYITLLAAAFVFTAAAETKAQSKTAYDKQQHRTNTTLSPGTEPAAPNVPERPTNVSQTREQELERENGYYQMPGERDWGTNAHMNGYPYPVIDPDQHPNKRIDTSGEQIQSNLYDEGGNKSGDGAPVRSKINQEREAREKEPANKQKNSRAK